MKALENLVDKIKRFIILYYTIMYNVDFEFNSEISNHSYWKYKIRILDNYNLIENYLLSQMLNFICEMLKKCFFII